MLRNGTWAFGYERPEQSQRKLFEAAGMESISETTADAARASWFLTSLPMGDRLSRLWRRICYRWPAGINSVARQGYMLVTVGEIG